MKILFVCGKNKLRSPTAEIHFSSRLGIETDSAGVSKDADQQLSFEQLEWADIVFFMEKKYQKRVAGQFSKILSKKKVVYLDIPDIYDYMQAELVDILETKVSPYLKTAT